MKKLSKLIPFALAAALLPGCRHAQVIEDKPIVYQQLPTRSSLDSEKIKTLPSCIVYTKENRVYAQNIQDASLHDLTEDLTKIYGPVENPKKIGNKIYFTKHGNLYYSVPVDAAGSTSTAKVAIALVGKDINASEYQISGNNIIFTTNSGDSRSSVKKLINGSLEELVSSSTHYFKDLEVSPDGSKAVCAKVPKQRGPSNSIYSKDDFLLVDLGEGVFPRTTRLVFDSVFPKYSPNEGPDNVSLVDNETILFTYRFPETKRNNLYIAKLSGFNKQYMGISPLSNQCTRLTSDEELILSAKFIGEGVVYVSTKSGVPELYLLNKGIITRLTDGGFTGLCPELRNITFGQANASSDAAQTTASTDNSQNTQ